MATDSSKSTTFVSMDGFPGKRLKVVTTVETTVVPDIRIGSVVKVRYYRARDSVPDTDESEEVVSSDSETQLAYAIVLKDNCQTGRVTVAWILTSSDDIVMKNQADTPVAWDSIGLDFGVIDTRTVKVSIDTIDSSDLRHIPLIATQCYDSAAQRVSDQTYIEFISSFSR